MKKDIQKLERIKQSEMKVCESEVTKHVERLRCVNIPVDLTEIVLFLVLELSTYVGL